MNYDSPNFKVLAQSADFVCIRLDMESEFNGVRLGYMNSILVMGFIQHLLDKYRLIETQRSRSLVHNNDLICQKIITPTDLLDKLQRQGML